MNTAVSALMIALRTLEGLPAVPKEAYEALLRLLAPFAPHLSEHLWEKLGNTESIHRAPWPVYDPALLLEETTEVVVQVNGKRKGAVSLAPDAPEEAAVSAARAIAIVQAALQDGEVVKVVYVPGRILNFVVRALP